MSALLSVLLVLHLLCWAVTLGTWVAAARTQQPHRFMAHAAGGALVVGVIMMGIMMSMGADGHLWFTLKLLFGLIVTALAYVAIRRAEETPAVVWYGIPLGIVLNVVVAVFGIGA